MSLSRFQGCLLGGLIGDCLGAPFEGNRVVSKAHLNKYFAQLMDPSTKLPWKPFTDDTAMTKSVALSLIENKGEFNPTDMAKRFCDEYFKEPKRGYGGTVVDIFQALRLSNYEDPFGPASRQFGGQGSYGNGAAMRVAPISLLTHNHTPSLLHLTEQASRLTHTNSLGLLGAVFQSLGIAQALSLHGPPDPLPFSEQLLQKIKDLEGEEGSKMKFSNPLTKDPETSYVKKIQIIQSFLNAPQLPSREEVDELLGVHVAAHRSVPTALYCYLAGQRAIPDLEVDTDCDGGVFQRVLGYAYYLGGDTDTIGSMAGALVGATVGLEGIPSSLMSRCEGADQALSWAQDLYTLSLTHATKTSTSQLL